MINKMDQKFTFQDEIILKGKWWVSSDNKLPGTFQFIPGQKNELLLSGTLNENDTIIRNTIDYGNGKYKIIEPLNKKYTIYGLTETNQKITLINCILTKQDNFFDDTKLKTTYRIQYCIFDEYINDLETLKIKSLSVYMEGILQFINRYNDTFINPNELMEVLIKTYEINDFKVSLKSKLFKTNEFELNSTTQNVYKMKPYIEVTSVENIKSYDDMINIFDKFKDLIILGLNNSVEINSINVEFDNKIINVIFLHEYRYKLRINYEIFKLFDINEAIIIKWFELYSKIPNIIQLLRSTIQNEHAKRLFIDNKFFNLASIFESLHHFIYTDRFIRKNENEDTIKKIELIYKELMSHKNMLFESYFKVIPAEIRQDFYFHPLSITFKDRLLYSIDNYVDYFNDISPLEMCEKIKNKRNGIAHAFNDMKMNGLEIHNLNLILKRLIYLEICNYLGIDTKINNIIKHTFKTI